MRAKFRGPSITINPDNPAYDPKKPSTSNVNYWKMMMESATAGLAPREFKPLKAVPHPRQSEMDAYRDIPSRFA